MIISSKAIEIFLNMVYYSIDNYIKRTEAIMDMEELNRILGEAVNDSNLHSNEIPSIDLYLDQILSLVADKQKQGAERFSDRVLTKTMVNNYSKDGLIKPISGKKYSKEHIIQMLVVYMMKKTFSISEIKRLLKGVYLDESFGGEELLSSYDRFMEIKDGQKEFCSDLAKDLLDRYDFDLDGNEDFFIYIMSLASMSAYLGDIARTLLESAYPDPELVEQHERDENKRREELEKELGKQEKKAKKDQKKKGKE